MPSTVKPSGLAFWVTGSTAARRHKGGLVPVPMVPVPILGGLGQEGGSWGAGTPHVSAAAHCSP